MQGMAQADGLTPPRDAPGQPRVSKLVLLGSGSVGKSSLVLRYVKDDFKSVLPTVGCECRAEREAHRGRLGGYPGAPAVLGPS